MQAGIKTDLKDFENCYFVRIKLIHMANIGFYELLIILGAFIFVFIIPFIFIYKYGKQKSRLKELERQIMELRNAKV